jgi:hypothetical protein
MWEANYKERISSSRKFAREDQKILLTLGSSFEI